METIKVELSYDQHCMITALLMMHYMGMVIPVHKDKRPILEKLANDFSLRNIQESVKPRK